MVLALLRKKSKNLNKIYSEVYTKTLFLKLKLRLFIITLLWQPVLLFKLTRVVTQCKMPVDVKYDAEGESRKLAYFTRCHNM